MSLGPKRTRASTEASAARMGIATSPQAPASRRADRLAGLGEDRVLHEMGHVLGLSASLWNQFGLITNTTQYTGQSALAEYRTLANNPGLTLVPLEDAGGPSTAGQH